ASGGERGPPPPPPPFRLTRYTGRRCAPLSAPLASQLPHLAGSLDAPRIATEAGSKSGVRSRGMAGVGPEKAGRVSRSAVGGGSPSAAAAAARPVRTAPSM